MSAAQVSLPLQQSRRRALRGKARPGLIAVRALARSAVRVGVDSGARDPSPHGGGPGLFVHEGARQVLERRLRRSLGKRINLAITDNRHTIVSCSTHPTGAAPREVRVHHMFLDADAGVQRALARYLKDGDRRASAKVGSFIDANQQRIRSSVARPKVLTEGNRHDLDRLFDQVNHGYFRGMVDASIGWARDTRRRGGVSRKSIKLGSYCAEHKLIRIHPALDQAWVPRYFAEYVVYHEMLHHMLPMPVEGGRRQLHTGLFLEAEQRFRHYRRAVEWEQQHLARLLRY